MGGAILKSWLEAVVAAKLDLDKKQIFVEDPGPSPQIKKLLSGYDIQPQSQAAFTSPPQLVMVAVKPQIMGPVLGALAPRLDGESLVLSIAAGKSLSDLGAQLPPNTKIVRMMPNTPVSVGAGMCVLVCNEFVTSEDRQKLEALMAPTGSVAFLEDESLMDAVTAVSGSGPAYVFLMAECLARAGVKAGLDEALALQLARQTLKGAGLLLATSDDPPSVLRENVTSKGGTTAAALGVLMEDEALERLFEKAILSAAARSKDLSG